jgi:D-3-phosphoglycerate dehydrogenase
VIALPHLGASTREAEENCAVMVADEVREYLENGNVRNSVNLPRLNLPRKGEARLAIVNANVPDMVAKMSSDLGKAGVNIVHMANESNGSVAYTLLDTEVPVADEIVERISQIDGVLKVRVL